MEIGADMWINTSFLVFKRWLRLKAGSQYDASIKCASILIFQRYVYIETDLNSIPVSL